MYVNTTGTPKVFGNLIANVADGSLGIELYPLDDNLKLFDDMAEMRPTMFCSVPRLYNRVYAMMGNFIQHFPKNGDPDFDIKRVKPPKSVVMADPDVSYALLSGAVVVFKPNEAAFEKLVEGMPSTHTVVLRSDERCCFSLAGVVSCISVITAGYTTEKSSIIVVGLSIHICPIEMREKLAIPEAERNQRAMYLKPHRRNCCYVQCFAWRALSHNYGYTFSPANKDTTQERKDIGHQIYVLLMVFFEVY